MYISSSVYSSLAMKTFIIVMSSTISVIMMIMMIMINDNDEDEDDDGETYHYRNLNQETQPLSMTTRKETLQDPCS